MPSLYTSIQSGLFNGDIWGQSGAWPNKTTDTEVLGAMEILAAWRVEIVPTLKEVLVLIPQLISFVGMKPHPHIGPHISFFPTPEGEGGNGYQVYQILVESWVIIGIWPELGFCRIVLSSCKRFNPNAVASWLSKKFGMVTEQVWGEL